MKLKSFLLCLLLATCSQILLAQSMSDSDVISMAKQLKAGGDSNRDITAKLLASGATRDQLVRIASRYNQGSQSPVSSGSAVDDETRVNNGEEYVFVDGMDTDDNAKKVFGRDVFRNKNLSFEPNSSMAIGQDYVVGPGDELIVDISGASQSSAKYKISPEGKVTIPKIGPIYVSGLSVEQAQARIIGAMGQHYQNASIKLTVGQTRTISINVMGDVRVPGTYTLSAFATVFHALYMAGGITNEGTLRDIKVARDGRIITTVDVYEYIMNGRLAGNIKLRDNDVIIVGSYLNLVQIEGNVKRPMWYEMKKGETISTLIDFANGFTGDAFSKSVTVNRRAGDKLSVNTVDEFHFGSYVLADEDEVIVRGNEQRFKNLVEIKGAVIRPGSYGLDDTQTLRTLIEKAGGLDGDAILNNAVIIRMNEDRTRQTISFDPQAVVNGAVADIPLMNEDVITIGSNAPMNDSRTMSIQGEVWNPGTFAYSANTSVQDLVTMAGGLRESASMLHVEVARRIIDPYASTDTDIRSKTFSFALDSIAQQNGSNFYLEPFDIVYIRRSPVYNLQRTVNVGGEVLFAGNYVLENTDMRISEIINRAGGFKKKACIRDARLIRQMNDFEIAREKQTRELALNSADSVDVNSLDFDKQYTVAIDLNKAMENPGGKEDIILRDGDDIFIPQVSTTVKVNGEVLYPNNITYDEGKKLKYYINQAGGFTKDSHRRKTFVVYANGHVSKGMNSKVESGCEVVVPVKRRHLDTGAATKWIALASSIATMAALIVTMIRKS